ncbi:MAG: hypothetical protein FJ260_02290 [Planctomycetes bacterium]|nr:hypothetical protein [Planctomycetota bacterium]
MRWLGVALAVGASASVAHAGVGDGAVQWPPPFGNGHWYELISKPASFEAAQAAAIARGGHLAVLTSADENEFVFLSVVSPGGHSNDPAWIGAQSIAGECDDGSRYLWVTGELFDYNNWGPKYPGDLDHEVCAAGFIPVFASAWANYGRSEQLNYVIEWSADCNGDGIVDYGQILQEDFADTNQDGIPDICQQPTCADADIYTNGVVNGADLAALLSEWGPVTPATRADINHDGSVNGADLTYLLSFWGSCP